MSRVACVVPTFAPDSRALLALLESVRAQDVAIIMSDDASPATSDEALRDIAESGIELVRHRRNAGIARGLNDGLRFASRIGAEWLLTVDQDSGLPPHHVEDLLRVASSSPRIGVVGVETVRDASGVLRYPTHEEGGLTVTEEVFQTGSLWSVPALLRIGGFDERLGIDAVDAAACLRLRQAGLIVAVAPGTHVEHRYGQGRPVQLLGRTVVATGHSPARRETMVRNRLALAPAEFRQSPAHAVRTLRRLAVNLALAASVEDDRLRKVIGGLRGLRPRR